MRRSVVQEGGTCSRLQVSCNPATPVLLVLVLMLGGTKSIVVKDVTYIVSGRMLHCCCTMKDIVHVRRVTARREFQPSY